MIFTEHYMSTTAVIIPIFNIYRFYFLKMSVSLLIEADSDLFFIDLKSLSKMDVINVTL